MNICYYCNAEIEEGETTCPNCLDKIDTENRCPQCDAIIGDNKCMCLICGTRVCGG